VQYLSSCIPLFRFKHCLFEALISAIHESEMRPELDEEDLGFKKTSAIQGFEILQDPISQERFLLRKYLEFMSHPLLQPLLLHSIKGDTFAFVNAFNRLTEAECPSYSRFKVSLYDINQRLFVIEPEPLSQASNDVYLVHYNGFVFGANYAKMIIIREREVEKNSHSSLSESSISECSSDDEVKQESLQNSRQSAFGSDHQPCSTELQALYEQTAQNNTAFKVQNLSDKQSKNTSQS